MGRLLCLGSIVAVTLETGSDGRIKHIEEYLDGVSINGSFGVLGVGWWGLDVWDERLASYRYLKRIAIPN